MRPIIPTTDDDDAGSIGPDPAFVAPVMLRARARTTPDAPFLTEVGGPTLSYAETLERVLRWGSTLAARGVVAGDRVASFVPASVDSVCVWFAASLLGAIEVPVNPELRGEFLTHVLTDSGARTCIVRPEQAALLEEAGVPNLDLLIAERDGSTLEAVPLKDPIFPAPTDVACVMYTSGTTGPSKGVVVTWAQTASIIGRLPRSWFSSADVTYAPWPMFHITGRSPVIVMLDAGGQVVLRERFSLSDFWPDVCRHGVTYTTVAAVLRLLLDRDGPAHGDHPLRIAFGGSDARANLGFVERFGVRIVTSYGSTEVGFPIVNLWYDESNAHLTGWPRRGYRLRAVDENGQDVGEGQIGQLIVKPPRRELMMREYLGRPELTAHAIVDGWYHTGDAVRLLEDGAVVFVDRMGDTIRRFGENISTVAVESVVAAHPDVAECAVVGVRSPVSGQDVMLVIVPARVGVDPATLFDDLRDLLPKHALPAYVALLPSLPKTPNGKTRKSELVELSGRAWASPVARTPVVSTQDRAGDRSTDD